MVDFSKIGRIKKNQAIEPRDLFMSLPKKETRFEYPRDVQTEVWKQWFETRNNKNNIIKMNTGSGKTTVGLVILQSSLNEGVGPAVYVVPSYLITQVEEEALALGIKTTQDENSLEYLDKKAILIINIQKLINGKSVFGLRDSGMNISIGSIIIDDVHACISGIEEQFSIKISRTESTYQEIIKIFKDDLINQIPERYEDIIEIGTSSASCIVPFWAWQKKITDVKKALQNTLSEEKKKFNYPLLSDNLELCSCFCSNRFIEIVPPCIPISKITGFVNAKRRIFMTATLPDDSIFISAIGLKKSDLHIISPEKANDIGDRLILFPQFTSPSIQDIEIKRSLSRMADKYNVIVLVPSHHRADFWRDAAAIVADSTNLDDAVNQLKNGHVGLVVFVNKYEGIDLPNEACRILVVDGTPLLKNSKDVYEEYLDPQSPRIWSKQIQKIEQGMGRGVRSSNDYSVIILMQKPLANVLFGNDAYNFFSQATRKQFELSKEIWNDLLKQDIRKYEETIEQVLARDEEWTTVSKEILATIRYDRTPHVDDISEFILNAFELAKVRQYPNAVRELRNLECSLADKPTKGLIKQSIAAYTNFFNQEEAQTILLSAISDNPLLLKPVQGIQFTNRRQCQSQSNYLIQYCQENNIDSNKYILKISGIVDVLNFGVPFNKFEAAMKDISFLLGIYSYRPGSETGKGPDNFWDVGDGNFFVIECKNETTTETISKHDCAQLNTSIEWFNGLYHSSGSCYPFMIHNSKIFSFESSPNAKIRIMTPRKLSSFKEQISAFSHEVVLAENFSNPSNITRLLNQHQLFGIQIFNNYTEHFAINNA